MAKKNTPKKTAPKKTTPKKTTIRASGLGAASFLRHLKSMRIQDHHEALNIYLETKFTLQEHGVRSELDNIDPAMDLLTGPDFHNLLAIAFVLRTIHPDPSERLHPLDTARTLAKLKKDFKHVLEKHSPEMKPE